MPITVAHPAILLPLRRSFLPFSALAIGAMVPDVPLWLDRGEYGSTHSLTGILTIDLAVGLVVWFVWARWSAVALADLAPSWVRARLAPVVPPSRRTLLLAVPAVLLGSASHVAWDAFTHPGEWGVLNIAWLGSQHGVFAGYAWAQYTSGVLGMGVLAVAAWLAVSRRSPQDPGPRVLPAPTAPLAFLACALLSIGTFLALLPELHLAAFRAALVGLGSVVLAVEVLTVAWQLTARR